MVKGLLAFTITASTLLVGFVSTVHAQNGMDPRARGCDRDGETLTLTSGGNYSRQWRPWERREIQVQLRKSNNCKANWVQADIPVGTQIYLKDESGKTYVPYTAKVDGWNYSDMWDYSLPFSACAKLPSGQEFCTSLVK